MQWTSLFLCMVLVSGWAAANPPRIQAQNAQQNSDARKLFVEGRDLQDDGKFSEAEKKFREALTKYPKAEQADRTAYYLISTLVKVGRATDARAEIDNFKRNYPQSTWKADVEEKSLAITPGLLNSSLNALVREQMRSSAAIELANAGLQRVKAELERSNSFPTTLRRDANGVSGTYFAGNASLESELMRLIIAKDADRGIEVAKDRLKTDPSDPAVISNLSAISSSTSNQALPFLMSIIGNAAASPNARSQAFFWASRRNGDKDQMAKTLVELMGSSGTKEIDKAVADTLQRYNTAERRSFLDQIAQSQNTDKVSLLDRIYRSSSVATRMDIVRAAAQIQDGKALAFLSDAAQNDKDTSVKRAAIQALAGRNDVDVKTLEGLLKAVPRTPAVQSVPPTPVTPATPLPPTPSRPK